MSSASKKRVGDKTAAALPAMPIAVSDANTTKQIIRTLRHFHLGNPAAIQALEKLGDNWLPVLLNPYRDASKLRYDYPLFMFPPSDEKAQREAQEIAAPLGQYFHDTVTSFAPNETTARILKDNLPWLERDLRRRINTQDGPLDALPLLTEACRALEQHLALNGDNEEKLKADIQTLLSKTPKGGQLMGYGQYPAIHLMIHVIRCHVIPRHAQFKKDVKQHIRDLKKLLSVDKSKSTEATRPEKMRGSVGGSADLFNSDALSSVMEHSRGSVAMPEKRRQRIEAALTTLAEFEHNPTHIQFVHTGHLQAENSSSEWLAETPGFETNIDASPCEAASRIFDAEAAQLAKVFAAARIAKLEKESRYDSSIHDPWFDNFNWEAFSKDELLLVPAVIALEPAERVANEGMAAFSRLLNSGRPVQILVRIRAHDNPGAGGFSSSVAERENRQDPFQSYRTELGYFGISHRQAVVAQSSAARHQHLLQRFSSALDATRTSLHLINIGLRPTGQDIGLNAWLVAGAALEGRGHPFFHINPVAGDSSAERMDFSGNPQPYKDWPTHPFTYKDQSGELIETELAFTFADYALLIRRLHKHFALVDAGCDSDDLVAIEEYLKLSEKEASERIPFIWAINEYGALRKLVISRTLVHACQDRLNFWHTLQELAGVRNRYVDQAISQTRKEQQEIAATERTQLQTQHINELEKVRTETASEVMSKLTDALLGIDLNRSAPQPLTSLKTATVTHTTEEIVHEPEVIEEEEEEKAQLTISEPWIDTPLCTSCNDCLVINPQLYVYDENNQAYLGDLSTGTYAQLVEGAELCPSKCIHPGLPQNPDEPGLEELISRAQPFN